MTSYLLKSRLHDRAWPSRMLNGTNEINKAKMVMLVLTRSGFCAMQAQSHRELTSSRKSASRQHHQSLSCNGHHLQDCCSPRS